MTGLFLLGIPCSGYTVLPQLQRATPPHARTAVISSHFNSWADFSGESLESQIRGNWDQADTLVAAANAREDFGGVVGGSYLVMYGLLLTAAVAVCFLIVKKAQQPQTEVTDGAFEQPDFFAPLPGGGEPFKWHAGMPLPSLEQLKNQCTIIGEELGCATPPLPRATATALHRVSLSPTGASMSCAPRPCTRVAIRTRTSARITASRCTSARSEDRATSLETRDKIVATHVTGARHVFHERGHGAA